MRALLLCKELSAAAGSAGAQMYRCEGDYGRPAFSDRPCPPGVKQTTMAATLAQQAKRMGISDRHLAILETQCREGNLFSCQALDDIKAGPAPEGDRYTLARRWKISPAELANLRDSCKEGNDEQCLRYERMKRSSPEAEATEKLALLARMCAFGNKDSCVEAEALRKPPAK
jgi:hypothetical protein